MQAFISFSRRDAENVARLCDALKKHGVDVWLPEFHIAPGQSIASEIEKGISKSDAMIVVLSPASSQSQNVSTETAFAFAHQRRDGKPLIIPVLIEQTENVPFFLRNFNVVDFTLGSNFDENIDRIVAAIRRGVREGKIPDSSDTARLTQLNAERELLESEKSFFQSQLIGDVLFIVRALQTALVLVASLFIAFVFLESAFTSDIATGTIGFISGMFYAIFLRKFVHAKQ
jgi:hypothetical protein